jgi:hypothetical protein
MDSAHAAAAVSDRPSLAFLKGRVVRLAGGIACPNCNHPLRAIDVIIDNVGPTLRCWNCHIDILDVESRD